MVGQDGRGDLNCHARCNYLVYSALEAEEHLVLKGAGAGLAP